MLVLIGWQYDGLEQNNKKTLGKGYRFYEASFLTGRTQPA